MSPIGMLRLLSRSPRLDSVTCDGQNRDCIAENGLLSTSLIGGPPRPRQIVTAEISSSQMTFNTKDTDWTIRYLNSVCLSSTFSVKVVLNDSDDPWLLRALIIFARNRFVSNNGTNALDTMIARLRIEYVLLLHVDGRQSRVKCKLANLV